MAVPRPVYSKERVRGGQFILRRPWQRIVFMSGPFRTVELLFLALIFGY
jgi:hypothetical protein